MFASPAAVAHPPPQWTAGPYSPSVADDADEAPDAAAAAAAAEAAAVRIEPAGGVFADGLAVEVRRRRRTRCGAGERRARRTESGVGEEGVMRGAESESSVDHWSSVVH